MADIPNTDQPSIGKMGRIALESINTLAGLYMSSVAKVDGLAIGNKTVLSGKFKSIWSTNQDGMSDTYSISLPLVNSGDYSFTVDWGDGNSDYITTYNQTEMRHTYTSVGTYSLIISGTCTGWSFGQEPDTSEEDGSSPSNTTSDCRKILSVQEWGCLRLGTENCNFGNCSNLTLNSVIDVLNLTGTNNLYGLFHGCTSLTTINKFNSWNLSNITNTSYMFFGSILFNQNIGAWNVSIVSDMKAMFSTRGKTTMIFNNGSNTSINNWNTSSVTDMSYIFKQSNFNQPIGNWNTLLVTTMRAMFLSNNLFNQSLLRSGNSWNTSIVTDMRAMFYNAWDFNQDISNWITTNVTDMSLMFCSARDFDYPVTTSGNIWNVSNVNNMDSMFAATNVFNQPLNSWDVSSVTSMHGMFSVAQLFDQPLSNWDVTSVTDMISMFYNCPFNQDISNWEPYNVYYMSGMFSNSLFNNGGVSLISNWFPRGPVYNPQQWVIQNMNGMFYNCPFNQPIDSWNTSTVVTMSSMFAGTLSLFNQDISSWDVSNVTAFDQFMSDNSYGDTRVVPYTYLDSIYSITTGWSSRSMQSGVGKYIDFGGAFYHSPTQAGRDIITGYGWSIRDNLIGSYSSGGSTGSSVLFAGIPGKSPIDIAIDSLDNIYTFNGSDFTISKITSSGIVSDFATMSGGATMNMIIDSSNNIYVPSDALNIVRKVTPSGVVTTYGSIVPGATNPNSCVFDSSGNLFVSNAGTNNITKITPGGVTSSLFANVGSSPGGIIIDSLNNLYIANFLGFSISKVTPSGTSSIFASLPGYYPSSLAVDSNNNIFVVDFSANSSIKKITPTGTITTFATLGTRCQEITIDINDNLFTNSRESNFIYKITPGGTVSVYGVTGNKPYGIAIDSLGNKFTVNRDDHSITKIS